MPDPTNEHVPELRTMLRGHQVEFACLGMRGNGNLGRVAETCTLLAVDHSLDLPYFTKKHGWLSGEVYKPASPPMLAGVGEWVEDENTKYQVVAIHESSSADSGYVIVGLDEDGVESPVWDAVSGEAVQSFAHISRITAVYANRDDETPIVSAKKPKFEVVAGRDAKTSMVRYSKGLPSIVFDQFDPKINRKLAEVCADALNAAEQGGES